MLLLSKQIEAFLKGIDYKYYAFFRFDKPTSNAVDFLQGNILDLLQPENIIKLQEFKGTPPITILSSYPDEWVKHYFVNEYYKIDPLLEKCRNSFLPFLWGEGSISGQEEFFTSYHEEYFKAARDFGIYKGIIVPLGPYNNVKAGVSISFGKETTLNNTKFFALSWHLTHLGNFIYYLQDKHDKKEPLQQEELVEIYSFLSKSHHSCLAIF